MADSQTAELNTYQLHTLRHMLGINTPEDARPKPYRNYYCANPGEREMHELKRLGMIELYDTRGDYEWWRCTEAGRLAAMRSHRTIRLSPAKRRYSRFLSVRECCPDITFREFLTDPRYAEAR